MSKTDVERPTRRPSQGVAKALDKGLSLVDMLADGAPIRVGQLVARSGLPRATVLRLLDVLCDHHVVEIDGDGAYGLGPRLAAWGHRYLDRLDLPEQASAIMDSLATATRETCFLGVRDGLQVLYVAKAAGPQPVQPVAQIGSRNPLHSTGIGKALLAFGTEDVLQRYLQEPLRAKTPNTIIEAGRLREELELSRARGYAVDDIENEEGVRCVAAPVRGHNGDTVAAISISAPAYRFALEDLPELAPYVISAAEELSRRIGFGPRRRPVTAGNLDEEDQ